MIFKTLYIQLTNHATLTHQKTGNELGRVHICCSTSATVEITEKIFKILHKKLPIEQ